MTTGKPQLVTKRKGETLRLVPKSDLVASSVESYRASMLKAVEAPGQAVVLDLSAIEQLDSLGITLVLGLFKTCQKAGAAFSVEGVKGDIVRVFKLFNLTKFFPVSEA